MSSSKFPTSASEVSEIKIPIGSFAVKSAMGQAAQRAVLTHTGDADSLARVETWMGEIAGSGRSRTAIYMEGGVCLLSESGSEARPDWHLVIGRSFVTSPSVLSKTAATVAAFAGIPQNAEAHRNCTAVAAMLRSIAGHTPAARVEEAYGDVLTRLGFIEEQTSYKTTVTITFDRESQPSAYEVRDWLKGALEKASPKPCGAPDDWLRDVSVTDVRTA